MWVLAFVRCHQIDVVPRNRNVLILSRSRVAFSGKKPGPLLRHFGHHEATERIDRTDSLEKPDTDSYVEAICFKPQPDGLRVTVIIRKTGSLPASGTARLGGFFLTGIFVGATFLRCGLLSVPPAFLGNRTRHHDAPSHRSPPAQCTSQPSTN